MRGFNREFNRARNVTRLDIDHCFASLRLRRFSFHVEIGNLCIRKRLLEVNLPVHDFGKKRSMELEHLRNNSSSNSASYGINNGLNEKIASKKKREREGKGMDL